MGRHPVDQFRANCALLQSLADEWQTGRLLMHHRQKHRIPPIPKNTEYLAQHGREDSLFSGSNQEIDAFD